MSTDGRSVAEWTTFAISCAVVAVVLVVVGLQVAKPQGPPVPVATVVGTSQQSDGRYVVQVVVRNEGGGTAADVQVVAELARGGTSAEADQVIDFLAGQQATEMAFVFDEDPAAGELEVVVASFALP